MKKILKKYKNEVCIGLLLIFIDVIFVLIYNTFLLAPDEYNYSHIAWTNIRIDSISKIIKSQISLYMNWTGRVPVHFIIQIILWWGIFIYKILNFLILDLFLIFIIKITNKKIRLFNIVLLIFCLLYTILKLGDKILWLSGSINYLWTSTLMLVLIKYFYDIVICKQKISIKKGLIYCIISFFCGWSQENVAFCMGAFIIILGLYKFKDFLKYDKNTKFIILLNIFCFGIGALFLIFSPGNFKRVDSNTTISIFENIKNILRNLYYIKYLIIIYLISIGIIIFSKNIFKENSRKEKIKFIFNEFIIFLLPLVFALLPMIIISEFPPRAMLPYEAFIFILITCNFDLIIENSNKKRIFNVITVILLFFIIAKLSINLYIAKTVLEPYKNKVENQIKIAKENNIKDLIITRLDDKNIDKDFSEILLNYSPSSSRDGIINIYMSKYYGFNSITAITDNEYLLYIKLKEPLENVKNYKIIDITTNEKILENNNSDIVDFVEIVIPKEQYDNYKIKFENNIIDKIEFVNISTNIDLLNKTMNTKSINYKNIIE